MIDMQKELQDLVTKNLPEQTAGAMKTYLAKMDGVEKAQVYLEAKVKELKAELETSKDIQYKQGTLLQQHDAITKRESEVAKKELRQEINDLKVVHANEKAELAKELVSLVFRNQTLVKSSWTGGSIPVVTKDQYSGNSIITPGFVDLNTTTTES